MSDMSTVSPDRYTVPFNVKYRPELGTAGIDTNRHSQVREGEEGGEDCRGEGNFVVKDSLLAIVLK